MGDGKIVHATARVYRRLAALSSGFRRGTIQIAVNDSTTLPELSDAQKTLFRRQVRAVAMLLVRIVLIALLTATLTLSVPWLRTNRAILDMGGGVLALWPLWSAVGRNWAWRIALGRAYASADRFADAESLLRPLDGLQGSLFDATGAGREALSEARRRLA